MAEMKQIAKNQSETIKQQNEIMANQARDLQMKAHQLEMERMQFEASRNADIRHNFLQMCDFAIRSLPWWKRSTKNVIDRATEYYIDIKREAAKHIAMEKLMQPVPQEVQEAQKEALENIADSIDGMDRESAELEQE